MRGMFKTEERAEQIYEPGVKQEADGIRFTVIAPYEDQVTLILYHRQDGTIAGEIPISSSTADGSRCSIKVLGLDQESYRYNYKIGNQIVSDPYARGIWKENGQSQCEIHLEHFPWGHSSKPRIPYEQGIMYHLHVRNYTIHEKSGVSHRGTFLGLQEKIPYLKRLGVNQILLMPVYEFEELEKPVQIQGKKGISHQQADTNPNYWGYKKGFYFAPKRRYAATENAVTELKNMVKAFHKNSMEILLEFYFPGDVVLREQMEIIKYWMEEYQVDGFRIMGETDLAEHLRGDQLFADCKILSYYLGESENFREIHGMRNMAEMNDGFQNDIRQNLKGDEGVLEHLAYRTRRSPASFGVVNYVTGHDGFTLQDLVSYDQKHNEENGEQNQDGSFCNYSWNCGTEGATKKRDILALRTRMKKNALMMLFFSQGTPMLLAGDEFGNSQNGNNNPYCLDNETSWVDWSCYRRNAKFFHFVKELIAFRKKEKLLHREKEYRFLDQQSCGYPDLSYHSQKAWYHDFSYTQRTLGMLYCGAYVKEEHFLYVMYNMHSQEQELALPKLPEKMKWYKKIDTGLKESFLGERTEIEKKVIQVPGRTIQLLIGEEE